MWKFVKSISLTKWIIISMVIGIVIGAAFTGIVNSLVNDLIMPLIGMVTGGINRFTFLVATIFIVSAVLIHSLRHVGSTAAEIPVPPAQQDPLQGR